MDMYTPSDLRTMAAIAASAKASIGDVAGVMVGKDEAEQESNEATVYRLTIHFGSNESDCYAFRVISDFEYRRAEHPSSIEDLLKKHNQESLPHFRVKCTKSPSAYHLFKRFDFFEWESVESALVAVLKALRLYCDETSKKISKAL